MASFTERMIGAAKLEVRAYEEVEADTTATGQAMAVVILSSIAAGIGGVGIMGLGPAGLTGFLVGSVAGLIRWVAWALLTYFIGTRLLPEPRTRADLPKLLRTTGFAQSPGVLLVVGVVPGFAPFILAIVTVWWLMAMVIAVGQALDYTSTTRALAVCVVGWVLSIVISAVIGSFFGVPVV